MVPPTPARWSFDEPYPPLQPRRRGARARGLPRRRPEEGRPRPAQGGARRLRLRHVPRKDEPEHRGRLEGSRATRPWTSGARPATATPTRRRTTSRRRRSPPPTRARSATTTQVTQFKKGKHALAWAAVKAMPTFHYQPMAIREGLKGCGGCHKIGLKSEAGAEGAAPGQRRVRGRLVRRLPHAPPVLEGEARRPRRARPATWGSTTRSGRCTRARSTACATPLKQQKAIPETSAGAHLPDLPHAGGQPRGAHRLGVPRGAAALARRTTRSGRRTGSTILQGLGVLDPKGNPTARLEVVKAADVARLTQEAFDRRSATKMLETCNQCHSVNFAKGAARPRRTA